MRTRILFRRTLVVSRPPLLSLEQAQIPVIEQWCLLPPPVSSSPYHCAKENVEVDEQETVNSTVEHRTGGEVLVLQLVVLLQKRFVSGTICIPRHTTELFASHRRL